jgi:hypothetical protein
MYSTIVLIAVITTLMAGPMLSRYKARHLDRVAPSDPRPMEAMV